MIYRFYSDECGASCLYFPPIFQLSPLAVPLCQALTFPPAWTNGECSLFPQIKEDELSFSVHFSPLPRKRKRPRTLPPLSSADQDLLPSYLGSRREPRGRPLGTEQEGGTFPFFLPGETLTASSLLFHTLNHQSFFS